MVLLGESTSFGRHPRNGIRLDHRTVSRFHGLFVRLPTGGYRVVDLGTKNGIRVNSWRIEESAALDTGDQIAAGNQVMVYESGDADDVESVSGLMTTLLVSTSGADPGDSTNGLELDAGASGLGVVTLSSLDVVESISETAGQWFDFYFPDNKRKGRVLPVAIAEWLRPQVKVADDGRLVIQPDPVVSGNWITAKNKAQTSDEAWAAGLADELSLGQFADLSTNCSTVRLLDDSLFTQLLDSSSSAFLPTGFSAGPPRLSESCQTSVR